MPWVQLILLKIFIESKNVGIKIDAVGKAMMLSTPTFSRGN